MVQFSLITVIGLGLAIIYMAMQWWAKRFDEKKKAVENEDQRIDAISNADDVTRIADELRDK